MSDARRYSWPQATDGNEIATKHGAWSPRKVDPLAVDIVTETLADVSWLRPADRPAVWAWARTEARIQLLSEWLAERGGDIDGDGAVRPAADLLTRLEARAESLRSKLGLDALSRARLGRDTAAGAVDLARLWAQEDGTGDGAPSATAAAENGAQTAQEANRGG